MPTIYEHVYFALLESPVVERPQGYMHANDALDALRFLSVMNAIKCAPQHSCPAYQRVRHL
jgi:hypothetical protein